VAGAPGPARILPVADIDPRQAGGGGGRASGKVWVIGPDAPMAAAPAGRDRVLRSVRSAGPWPTAGR